jgi:hypothetical protein
MFTSSYFKPKLNVMDNQAMKRTKMFLTNKDFILQFVEPHNHCANKAECASLLLRSQQLKETSPSSCGID